MDVSVVAAASLPESGLGVGSFEFFENVSIEFMQSLDDMFGKIAFDRPRYL